MQIRMLASRQVHVDPSGAWPDAYARWEEGDAYTVTEAQGAALVAGGWAIWIEGPPTRKVVGPAETKVEPPRKRR